MSAYLLFSGGSGGISYPFQIWEGADTYDPTFVTSPAWNTLLSGPAYKYLNLLSEPAGNTLDGLTSIGNGQPNYQGIVTLPPLPASLSVTLNFSISIGVNSISSPTVRSMNLGYPDYDANQLTYLNFPKWEVGSFALNNFNSVSLITRFEFPEYRGDGYANLTLTDSICNFDFPKLVALNNLHLENSNPSIYPFTCTFPLLATVADLYITQCSITGDGKVVNLPVLTTVSGNNNCYVLADSFYAPLFTTVGFGSNVTFGGNGARLYNLNVGLNILNGRVLYVYMDNIAGVFNLFGGSISTQHGDIWIYVTTVTLAQADSLWQTLADTLFTGGPYGINAPEPTLGINDPNVIILQGIGYTCGFTL